METSKALENKKSGFAFDEDPQEYCKQIYNEGSQRIDNLKDRQTENMEFYCGKDKVLEEIANNARVRRSHIFVHELTPAIDSRVGFAVSKLSERKRPVVLAAADETADDATKDMITAMEIRLDQQMRGSKVDALAGYLEEVFEEQALAAEIYTGPAVIKVGWRTRTVMEPVPYNTNVIEQAKSILTGKSPLPGVRLEKKDIGEPYCELLRPDEFLFKQNISCLEDSPYCIHSMWLYPEEIRMRAIDYDYDIEKVEQYFEEFEAESDDNKRPSTTDDINDRVQETLDTPHAAGYHEGKHLFTENYIITVNEDGEEEIKLCVMLGNKYLINESDTGSPYKLFKHPFIPLLINKLPGTMDTQSTIDKGKDQQRLYLGMTNAFLDGLTYRNMPPFKAKKGTTFAEQPIYGPGEIWFLSDPDSLRPVVENPGMLPDLASNTQVIASKIRELVNSTDLSQGFQSKQYEKATATKARMLGAGQRAAPTLKKYGKVVIEVAKKYIAMNIQFAEDGYNWTPKVVVDVPSLTGITDPENEKQEALLLLSEMGQNPVYKGTTGLLKIRNMTERVYRTFKMQNIDDYVPTVEELMSQIKAESDMQDAMVRKANIQEQIGLTKENANAVPVQ